MDELRAPLAHHMQGQLHSKQTTSHKPHTQQESKYPKQYNIILFKPFTLHTLTTPTVHSLKCSTLPCLKQCNKNNLHTPARAITSYKYINFSNTKYLVRETNLKDCILPYIEPTEAAGPPAHTLVSTHCLCVELSLHTKNNNVYLTSSAKKMPMGATTNCRPPRKLIGLSRTAQALRKPVK